MKPIADVSCRGIPSLHNIARYSNRWNHILPFRFNAEKAGMLPYPKLNTESLMVNLERFFKSYLAAKGQQFPAIGSNFLAQAIWINDKCQNFEPAQTSTGYKAIGHILSALQLEGWPYESYGGDILSLVASGDRRFMLYTLFQVLVLKVSHDGTSTEIILKPPRTLLKRFSSKRISTFKETYAANLLRTIKHVTSQDVAEKVTEGIFRLEETLQSMIEKEKNASVVPPVKITTSFASLRSHPKWDWSAYFRLLFGDENRMTTGTNIVIENPTFFDTYGSLFDDSFFTSIANYVALKAITLFSPFMTEGIRPLMDLSHDFEVPSLSPRFVACHVLLEKLYKYGIAVAAKLTLSKDFPTTYRTSFDNQLQSIFGETRKLLTRLTRSKHSWLSNHSSRVTVGILESMTAVLGTQATLKDYEVYRKTHTLLLRHDNSDVAESVVRIMEHGCSRYWEAATTPDNSMFDNLYTLSVFEPGHEYQKRKNLLFLSEATVSFLAEVSNTIHFLTYPAVVSHVVRGMLESLLERSTFPNGRMTSESWWDKETKDSFKSISDCLRHQYLLGSDSRNVSRSWQMQKNDFLDNAVVYPLYELYKAAVKDANMTNMFYVAAKSRRVNVDQLFFYNYAAAFCDATEDMIESTRQNLENTPARQRVNVPFRNMEEFGRTFRCAEWNLKNTNSTCSIWERGRLRR